MTVSPQVEVVVKPSTGRAYFWVGLALCPLAIVLLVIQYGLKQLNIPWYVPILTTLGAVLLFVSVLRRRGVVRIVMFGLVSLLAGAQWLFLVSLSRLDPYTGPARVAQQIPAFSTTSADGTPFTDADLRQGRTSVLVFFRGRW